jgi:hypothetical protein
MAAFGPSVWTGRALQAESDAGHGHYPATTVVCFRQGLDFISHGFNSIIELPPVAG